jgi:hypothetical protein
MCICNDPEHELTASASLEIDRERLGKVKAEFEVPESESGRLLDVVRGVVDNVGPTLILGSRTRQERLGGRRYRSLAA